MCETGEIPNDYEVNKTITIPRKVGKNKCENYRTVSLTTHAFKILTTIIYRKIEQTKGSSLDEDQFGFRKEKGTREALLSLGLIQNDKTMSRKTYFYCVFQQRKSIRQRKLA